MTFEQRPENEGGSHVTDTSRATEESVLSEMASVRTLTQEYLWQDSDHGKKTRALTPSEHGGKEAVRVRTLAFTLSKELLEGLETKSVTI